MRIVVAGAGLAGLVAAAEARGLGAEVELREKGDRAGGAMLLSSGVIWRHRDLADFEAECPGGDRALQRVVWERLDEDLAWLESLGAPVVGRETGNPRTTGLRFDTAGLTAALLAAAGEPRLRDPLTERPGAPVVLATGGFAAGRDLVARHITPEPLLLRSTPWSTGDGLRLGLEAGGAASAGLDEFYGRLMPAPPARIAPDGFVPLAQLYARQAEVRDTEGETYVARTWSENDVVQWLAHRPGARGTLTVPADQLDEQAGPRTIGEMVGAAEHAGARVERQDGVVRVHVAAAITTTLGGLRIDPDGQVAPGVFAAGQDAGGVATGGYASGLAAALVQGRLAARAAVAAARS